MQTAPQNNPSESSFQDAYIAGFFRPQPYPKLLTVAAAGVVDMELEKMSRLGTGRDYHNAARKLHMYLHKEGKTLPASISSVNIPVKRMKKGGGEIMVQYPVMFLSSWMSFILESAGGEFLLAGCTVRDVVSFTTMFGRFWDRYYSFDKDHPIYKEKGAQERMFTIPVAIHGDEGRGAGKLPVMVESYQPVIPWSGENELNLLKCLGMNLR